MDITILSLPQAISVTLAVDRSYIPVEREVKLSINTSLHMLHAQQSRAAVKAPAALKTNLVVVTGYPTWYSTNPLMTIPITGTVRSSMLHINTGLQLH